MSEIADRDTLVQKRGRIKAKITRIETYVSLNENNMTIDVNEFVIRESMLVRAYEDYDVIQDTLESIEAEQEQDRVAVEGQYTTLHSKLKTIIQTRSRENNNTQSRLSNVGALSTAPVSQVKLPNINIPVFSGKYENYRPFIELFTALIDADIHLNNVQKLLYLKTVLKDEPLSMVNELPITDANYTVALDLLRKRYDVKLVTINCHIRGLLDAQVTKGNQGALRDFIVKIKQHYKALEALEVPVEHWDLILVHIMSSRLDFHTHRVYELERDPQVLPTCLALETLAPSEPKQKITTKSYHSVSDSNTGTTTQKRDFVIKNRLCFNCLGQRHTVNQCKSDGCRVCHGKHHTVLHDNKGRERNGSQGYSGQTKVTDNQEVNNQENGVAPSLSTSSVATIPLEVNSTQQKSCLLSNTNKQILLATALVNLIGYGGCKVEARALLDSGSQSSFITAEMANKLKAKLRNTNIRVSGLGQNGVRVSNTITIICESQKEPRKTISVVCGVLDKITCPLPHTYVDIKEINIPDDLSLADRNFYIPRGIDLLLGADVYFDIVQSGILRLGENLPVLQNSLFGWVIGGNVTSPQNHLSNVSVSLFSHSPTLEVLIPQFWRLEEVSNIRHMSPQDKIRGTDTLEKLMQLQGELTDLLKSGGFRLHKWNSNVKALLNSSQNDETKLHFQPENSTSKVLGISWNPTVDCFQISVPKVSDKTIFTKREVLRIIAQIFDPMGFVGPVIIVAKVLMQRLWCLKLEWDETLPPDVLVEWLKFYKQLSELTKLTLSRWNFMPGTIVSIQLIGFSDASMKAYGACLGKGGWVRRVRAGCQNDSLVLALIQSTADSREEHYSIDALWDSGRGFGAGNSAALRAYAPAATVKMLVNRKGGCVYSIKN
ncbi:hypothetical protein NQ317_013554 [Molorchus minor]|uniref:DUF1758 domain-containing protein n=1 Tax=Molorchus minor TaxID=1323400 RepID=A0ABQ9JPC0_9CUCU|nr:hypothetical protein NQ317_013554 [Molorchus minor]